MRMQRPLDDLLGRRSKVALLRYLILSGRETTGRDLARSVGIDHKACLSSLAELWREGIIHQRRVGRAWFHSLNADFPLVREALVPLFDWERNLPERLARDIRKGLGRQVLSVFLYGSTAKGTDTSRSDIDLLLVARDRASIPALQEKADEMSSDIIRNYSRVPQLAYMDAGEFAAKFVKSDSLLMEILRSGHLLDGLREEELLSLGRAKDRRRKRPPR